MECADDGNAKLPKAAAAVVLRHQVDDLRIAVTDVYPHGQVEAAHLVVKRIEVGIGDEPGPFDAAHEHAAGPVLVAKLELLQRCAHIEQRQSADPPKPPLTLPVNVGEPAVIALANGGFPLGLVGYLLHENHRIEHLDLDTQLYDVLALCWHVYYLAGFTTSI